MRAFKMAISRQQLPKTTDRKQKKVSKVMREFKKGKLNIGNLRKRLRIESKP